MSICELLKAKMKRRSIVIGKYTNTNSIIHKMNPLTKFIVFILMLTLTFWGHLGFEQFIYICMMVIMLFIFSKIPLRSLLSQARNIIFLFLVIFLIGTIFTNTGTHQVVAYDHIGTWKFPAQNLPNTLFIVGRIFLIINIAAFLTSTSTSSEITSSILYILRPFRIVKLPVDEIALMISIALRFIPTFITEADIIIKAQASRGIDINTKNPRQKITAFIALIIPLFLSAFSKAEELSSAMDSRGYIIGAKRTKIRRFILNYKDGFMLVLVCSFFIFIIVSLHFLTAVDYHHNHIWMNSFWNWWGWRQPSL